ncbi:MAG: MBL fold metallo-hydrolase, partial [Acidimicrobiia bacterium]
MTPSSAASATTRKANDALRASLPFHDRSDFENAKRGLIAELPNNGVVKDSAGNVVWDLAAFRSFISEDVPTPETANPSLWRQAQLLMFGGLFEVVEGVYQVRGADLSNMTIVEGDRGVIIVDPLISKETARYALDLYFAERGTKPVTAIIYSHSHIDHFGGVRGIVDEAALEAGDVSIFAPDGFLDHAIEENVYAGTAMGRRASYMYGNLLPKSATGQMTAGLGVTTSSGEPTVIPPTHIVERTGDKYTIDGIEHAFVMAPGSEAPSEMMWYMPKFKMLNMAEDSTHNMHNLYTLRG